MKITVLSISELAQWARGLPTSPVIATLLAGDRLSCCDEAVVLKIGGEIVGVATIAPRGEYGAGGQPTIVALYIVPAMRRHGYGRILFEAAINRCIERGFLRVRVDVMSHHLMRIIDSLPTDLRSALDVHDMGAGADYLVLFERRGSDKKKL